MAQMQFPAMAEAVPGKLAVKIYLHEVVTDAGPVKCWTYLTEGLWVQKHKEIALTLPLAQGEMPDQCPSLPIQFFGAVYGYAAKGTMVDVGAYSDFGPNGFLGRRGIGYVEAAPFEDFVSLSPTIAAILLTEEELAVYNGFGLSRVQAMLGKAHSYFPCPHWSDRKRPSIVPKDVLQKSLVARWPQIRIPGARARIESGVVTLSLPHSARYKLVKDLADAGGDTAFALILDIGEDADGCMVWVPGEEPGTMTAIAAPGVKQPKRLALCHLSVSSGQAEDGIRFVEDGLLVTLKSASWPGLRNALMKGQPCSISCGKEKFQLEWRPLPAVETRGAWMTSSGKDLKARVGGVALHEYARAIEAAVLEGANEIGLNTGRHDIRMLVTLHAGKSEAEVQHKALPELPAEVLEYLVGQVTSVTAPRLSGEPVELEFLFGVKGGTGTLKILE